MDATRELAPNGPALDRPLPSGLVFFLFTDIEGSTVRWDRDPEAMQRAVRRHDVLMRDAIERAGGTVFKTIGDAFCAVFWSAADAVAAALGAQQDLAAEDFSEVGGVRVRKAIHGGTADERDSDYFGPTVNRVARLLAIGHGEQVLLSGAAAEAAIAALPGGVTLNDMGEHRLKDLTAPERVFQLTAPGMRFEFPRLNSLSVRNNNFPKQLTSLVGREQDVVDIVALLNGNHLVTLVGTGGVGKTRSLQVGAELLDKYSDGAWFADLAPISDPAQVIAAIAAIFSIQESANRPLLDSVIAQLRTKQLVLILDNCEHVIEAASQTAAALLRSCPGIVILATSREPLNIPGEIVHRLPTLSIPRMTKFLTVPGALQYGAVALFDARARAANARFAVTADNVGTVVEICTRLDGIALAIELAAARIKVMSLRDLAGKLDERFRVLTGGDRTALPRQETLRALIDWSYDGLPDTEKIVFRSLAVFAGGFGLRNATAVCAGGEIDEYVALDAITALVDKSMMTMEERGDDEVHYRLLESTRAYARDKLVEQGEFDAVAERHAIAYAAWAEDVENEYDATPTPEWYGRIDFELENVRSALSWSLGGGDTLVGQRLAATLGRIMLSFAAAEARRWVTVALERVDDLTPPEIVARLKLADALLASVLNQFKGALTSAQEALARFTELGDKRGIADAQRFAGRSMIRMGQVAEGEKLLYASLQAYVDLGLHRQGGTLRDLAVARSIEGDLSGARDLFTRALDVFRTSQDEENVALTGAALAEAEFACGDPERALIVAEEALEAMRGFGRDRMAAAMLGNIAAYLIAAGLYDLAHANAHSALKEALEADAQASVTFALQHLAAIAALRPSPDDERAARLTGFVDGRLAALDVVREFTEQHEYEATLTALRTRLAPEKLDALLADGRSTPIARALDWALAI